LSKAITYVREHFQYEEKIMDEISYPYSTEHKSEHIRVINEMQLAIMHWRESKNEQQLKESIEIKIPNWFMEHIIKMDGKLVEYSKK